jgi:hypothetical protein
MNVRKNPRFNELQRLPAGTQSLESTCDARIKYVRLGWLLYRTGSESSINRVKVFYFTALRWSIKHVPAIVVFYEIRLAANALAYHAWRF